MIACEKLSTLCDAILVNDLISVLVLVRRQSLRSVSLALVPPTSPMSATISSGSDSAGAAVTYSTVVLVRPMNAKAAAAIVAAATPAIMLIFVLSSTIC